jgi:hypothetical protein
MKQVCYLSGPMSGLPNLNRAAFAAEAARLRDLGVEVVNPAEVQLPPDAAWEDFMRADIKLMMDCTTIVLLPGFERSRGAVLEHHIARALGMRVVLAAGRSPWSDVPARTDWAAA